MWIAITTAWILGCIIFYGALIKTAKEANKEDYFCNESEYDSYACVNEETEDIRRAA